MINATLCRTSLIQIVGSVVLCKLWISLSCDSHWLFERSLLWSRMLLPTCVWDVVFRHETCVPDMSARVLSRFSLGIVNNEANRKVQVNLYGNPGEAVFNRKRPGPFAGPAHNSSVFDSVRLLQHESFARKERAGPRRWQRHRHWPPC